MPTEPTVPVAAVGPKGRAARARSALVTPPATSATVVSGSTRT